MTEAACPLGFKLLRCLHSYLVVDMYMALEVHTDDTLAAGRAAVGRFTSDLQARHHLHSSSQVETNSLMFRDIFELPQTPPIATRIGVPLSRFTYSTTSSTKLKPKELPAITTQNQMKNCTGRSRNTISEEQISRIRRCRYVNSSSFFRTYTHYHSVDIMCRALYLRCSTYAGGLAASRPDLQHFLRQ